MAQFNSQEVQSSYGHRGKRLYYCYGDELYAGTFPEEWAQDHAPGTGPGECEDCRVRGGWNGVFMLYCANCAIHVYHGERGKGAISPGEEYDGDENREFRSAFKTYLYDVNLNDVGDTDFRDSYRDLFNEYADEFAHLNPRVVAAAFSRMREELLYDGEQAEYVDYFIDTNGSAQDVSEEHVSDAGAAAWDECARRREHRNQMYDSDDDYARSLNTQDMSEQHISDADLAAGYECARRRRRSSRIYDYDDYSDISDNDHDVPLDETAHCMICENTKYNCACDEELIHQSVFCYTCENPRYDCDCDEESRNKTHYCLHCSKVKYNCICVGENSVYLRVARKYCMLQHSEPVQDEEPEYATLVRFVPPNKV